MACGVSSYRQARCATHPQYTAHHADVRRCCAVDGSQHGRSRAGVNCSFPSTSLARTGARVLDVFVATSTKAAVLSPGFAGAKPRRRPQTFHQCHMYLLGRRLQLSFSMPCRHGFPRFQKQLF